MPTQSCAYSLLLQKAAEIHMPYLWCADLVEHDKKRLQAPDAPQEFCWSVRETGTWFVYGGIWRSMATSLLGTPLSSREPFFSLSFRGT